MPHRRLDGHVGRVEDEKSLLAAVQFPVRNTGVSWATIQLMTCNTFCSKNVCQILYLPPSPKSAPENDTPNHKDPIISWIPAVGDHVS